MADVRLFVRQSARTAALRRLPAYFNPALRFRNADKAVDRAVAQFEQAVQRAERAGFRPEERRAAVQRALEQQEQQWIHALESSRQVLERRRSVLENREMALEDKFTFGSQGWTPTRPRTEEDDNNDAVARVDKMLDENPLVVDVLIGKEYILNCWDPCRDDYDPLVYDAWQLV